MVLVQHKHLSLDFYSSENQLDTFLFKSTSKNSIRHSVFYFVLQKLTCPLEYSIHQGLGTRVSFITLEAFFQHILYTFLIHKGKFFIPTFFWGQKAWGLNSTFRTCPNVLSYGWGFWAPLLRKTKAGS